jgi:hypothetical protein
MFLKDTSLQLSSIILFLLLIKFGQATLQLSDKASAGANPDSSSGIDPSRSKSCRAI